MADPTDNPQGPAGQVADGANPNGNGQAQAPNSQGGEPETFFDPKKVSPELMPAYKQMQAQFTKANMGLGEARKIAEVFKRAGQDPATARQIIDTLSGHHKFSSHQPNGNNGSTQVEDEGIPQEILNDPRLFRKFMREQASEVSGADKLELERKFQAQLSAKDQELTSLKIKLNRDAFPLAERFESEIQDRMSRNSLSFEDAYDLVTASERETVAIRRGKEERQKAMDEALGTFTEGPDSSSGTQSGSKKGLSLREIYEETEA